MVKSGAKRKKADKAKVQLKGNKKKAADLKLPKGLNVTRADVKTKTIVVQNQLKKSGDENQQVTTRKKLGLTDLLPKVANLSVSTRVEGLEGLMELLQGHPDILETNSSLILAKLLPLLTEREGKVRSSAGKILQVVFQIMSTGNGSLLEPLYEVICVHLCCALSHIDVSVQRGALRVLDTVIEHLPELVRRHSDQVLPNCLSQIAVKGGKLDAAMDNDVTSVQRRTEVINRIVRLLKILDANDVIDDDSVIRVHFDGKTSNHFALFPEKFDLTSLASDKAKKGFRMDEFLEGMVPVLLDVWTEAGIVQGKAANKKAAKALQTENLEILCHVTESLSLICKAVAKKAGKFKRRIVDEVIHKFPVVTNKSDDEIVALNMNLCSLYLTLEDEQDEETSASVIDYVASLLKANKVQDLKRHMGTVAKVALALDRDHALLGAGLLSVSHPEIDRYVCQAIKRPIVSEERPKLIRHIARAVLSTKTFCEAHSEAVLLLVKRCDPDLTEAVVQALEAEKRPLQVAVQSEAVCRTLAIALKDAPESTKDKLRQHIQSLDSIGEYSRSFCLNALAAVC